MLFFRLSPQNIQEGNFFGLLLFAQKWCSISSHWKLSQGTLLYVPRCSEAVRWHFSLVLSGSSGWIACWCYTWPKRLKIVEPSSGCIRILPGSWKSAWLCKVLKCWVAGACPCRSNSFCDGCWVFSPYGPAKAPNLGASILANAKSKRSQMLVFWWDDGNWLDGYLCLSLQPTQLSDVVISMVTQTPRLLTAACEEQHSAAQGSHDQVSQK